MNGRIRAVEKGFSKLTASLQTHWFSITAALLTSLIGLTLAAFFGGYLTPRVQSDTARINHLNTCVADGTCLGGNVTFTQITCTVPVDPSCTAGVAGIQKINGIFPDVSNNFGVNGGANILVSGATNSIDVSVTQAVSITDLAVSQSTLLGQNTSCIMPLLPSCYDISNQACLGGSLAANCLPSIATFDIIYANQIIIANNGTVDISLNQTSLVVETLISNTTIFTGTTTCTEDGTISNSCLRLGGYSCPMGQPLAESCIPANLVQYNMDVTNQLTVNTVQCLGPPLNDTCIPTLAGDVTGTNGANTLSNIQGVPLVLTNLTAGDVLTYTGSSWVNSPKTVAYSAQVEATMESGIVSGNSRLLYIVSGVIRLDSLTFADGTFSQTIYFSGELHLDTPPNNGANIWIDMSIAFPGKWRDCNPAFTGTFFTVNSGNGIEHFTAGNVANPPNSIEIFYLSYNQLASIHYNQFSFTCVGS